MPDPLRTSTSPPSQGRRLRDILGKNARALSFIPRERRFYELFERQAAVIVRSASLLELALAEAANLPPRQQEIKKALEHQGDEITHEIVRTLNRTFVTPFDHEDIYALASGLDDILDYIEEVADTANLYAITHASWRGSLGGRSRSLSRRSASSSPVRGSTSTAPRSTSSRMWVMQRRVAPSPNSSAANTSR